jgi:hypothetical protein
MHGNAPVAESCWIPPSLPTGQGTTISTWVDGGLINKSKNEEKRGGNHSPSFFVSSLCFYRFGLEFNYPSAKEY